MNGCRRRLALALLAPALAAAVLSGCGGGDGVEVRARFDDVGDLAEQAPVLLADIRVGKVTDISLDGHQALVTMVLDRDADVPRDVIARVRRTSLLGERVIDLVIPETLPEDAPSLRTGDLIEETDVRPDLEDLVVEGNDVLAPIAASEVATLVDEGAAGFGEQGDELRALLSNFARITDTYAARTDTLRGVVRSIGEFNAVLARQAGAHARSVASTRRSIRMLREEGRRLEVAVQGLTRLSVAGADIMADHRGEMDRFFDQMNVILGVLRSEQEAIEGLLAWAPNHNRNTQLVEYTQFNLILQEFIICGLNDDPSDPGRRCTGDGRGA
jgi:phospholipid/cholesterol/gamma-HCH transport system substrate-binding protein